jgi:exosortase/archaeosortase family protein
VLKKIRNSAYFPVVVFLGLFFAFYGFSLFTISITTPGGLYNEFAEKHLDWFSVLRTFLLEVSTKLLNLLGYEAYLYGKYKISIPGKVQLRMIHSCVGMGLFSFWWAMILAFPQSIKNKIRYFLIGTLLIITLNILRITAVAIAAVEKKGNHALKLDHHLLFNVVVYAILFFMLYRWFNIKDRNTPSPNQTR